VVRRPGTSSSSYHSLVISFVGHIILYPRITRLARERSETIKKKKKKIKIQDDYATRKTLQERDDAHVRGAKNRIGLVTRRGENDA
jgi:hypothetical protein